MRRKQIMNENLRANILGKFNETWKLQGKLRESSALLCADKFIETFAETPQDEILVRLINTPRA